MTDERPDITTAKDKMRFKLGGGREVKKLPEHLWEGETVERMTAGRYGNGTGLIILTDRRLLFLKDGRLSKKSEDFPLGKVSSISWSSGIALGSITIFVSGTKAEIKNVNKGDGKEMVDLIRGRLSSPAPDTSETDAPAQPDAMTQLKQLGEMRDSGMITEEEFEAKKAEILGRM